VQANVQAKTVHRSQGQGKAPAISVAIHFPWLEMSEFFFPWHLRTCATLSISGSAAPTSLSEKLAQLETAPVSWGKKELGSLPAAW
jgi:hypothetical protein